LYHFKLNENVNSVPTVGFNVETINYKNIMITMWDVGGQHAIRKLWNHYFEGCNAVIFVVDSADQERMEETKEELHRIMNDYRLRESICLIYANKQDLPGALDATKLCDSLDLNSMKQKWFIQPSVATNGEGLYEGLDWISNNLTSSTA
jgi:ADP-ribosylation factor protein 1